MSILHISQSDLSGGAAISAYRLHKGLLGINVSSRMLVHDRRSSEPEISRLPQWHRIWRRVRSHLEAPDPLLASLEDYVCWSFPLIKSMSGLVINRLNPSIVNLHGIDGLLGIPDLADIKAPLVWTVHDEWAASCGYHFWIPRNESSLSNGPFHDGLHPKCHSVQEAKAKYWKNLNLTIVSPSQWLAQQMRLAPHFSDVRIEVIPYGLENTPVDGSRNSWRAELGISEDSCVITYGAGDALGNIRKGDDLFFESILKLAQIKPDRKIQIMIFGDQSDRELPQLPFHVIRHGTSANRSLLTKIYGATDCFVCPSRADNLPNTVLEALSTGTPCAGFRIGGVPDMIVDGISGFTAEPFDTTDLAYAIIGILEADKNGALREMTRSWFLKNYTLEIQANKYQKLYSEII